jgi:hypothetical protein
MSQGKHTIILVQYTGSFNVSTNSSFSREIFEFFLTAFFSQKRNETLYHRPEVTWTSPVLVLLWMP